MATSEKKTFVCIDCGHTVKECKREHHKQVCTQKNRHRKVRSKKKTKA